MSVAGWSSEGRQQALDWCIGPSGTAGRWLHRLSFSLSELAQGMPRIASRGHCPDSAQRISFVASSRFTYGTALCCLFAGTRVAPGEIQLFRRLCHEKPLKGHMARNVSLMYPNWDRSIIIEPEGFHGPRVLGTNIGMG